MELNNLTKFFIILIGGLLLGFTAYWVLQIVDMQSSEISGKISYFQLLPAKDKPKSGFAFTIPSYSDNMPKIPKFGDYSVLSYFSHFSKKNYNVTA